MAYRLPDEKANALVRVAWRLGAGSNIIATTAKAYEPMVWFNTMMGRSIGPLTSLDLWALDHLAQVAEHGYAWEAKDVLR